MGDHTMELNITVGQLFPTLYNPPQVTEEKREEVTQQPPNTRPWKRMRASRGVSDSDGAGMTPRGPLAVGRPVVSAHPKCELQLLRKELKRPSCFESLTTGPGKGWAASSAPGTGPGAAQGLTGQVFLLRSFQGGESWPPPCCCVSTSDPAPGG